MVLINLNGNANELRRRRELAEGAAAYGVDRFLVPDAFRRK